jgi:hypothetical protein
MKPRSGTGATRRGATDGQCEPARLIARTGPGAACPDNRAAVLAAVADAAGLLRTQAVSCPGCELAPSFLCGDHKQALVGAEGCNRLAGRLRGQP